MTRTRLAICLAALAAPGLALAQPAGDGVSEARPQSLPQPQAPTNPALDAAFGRPPPGAQVDPTTREAPGFLSQPRQQSADRTYGPTTRSVGPDGKPVSGFQYLDPELLGDTDAAGGNIPEYHTVQKGDTLWGLSGYYFGDPYQWPKLWSYNEHITNAHWIFPGDRVRLTDPYQRAERGVDELEPEDAGLKFSRTRIPVSQQRKTYVLEQTAFVSAEDLDAAMEVVGGAEAKVMMGTLDTVYMEYKAEDPPVPGERLVVYAPQEAVTDIKSRKILGYLVEVVGEVEVDQVARKTAEGTLAVTFNPVERGYKVGPLRRRFRQVDERPAETSEVGRVVASLAPGGLIEGARRKKRRKRKRGIHDPVTGSRQYVVVNLGADDGVQEGNVLEAVRKGDEYMKTGRFKIPYEEGWPRRVIGRILVLDVQPSLSLGVVTWARRELERGEYVELVARGMQDASSRRAARLSAGAEADVRADEGRVEGQAKGGFKLGN